MKQTLVKSLSYPVGPEFITSCQRGVSSLLCDVTQSCDYKKEKKKFYTFWKATGTNVQCFYCKIIINAWGDVYVWPTVLHGTWVYWKITQYIISDTVFIV